MDEEYQQSVISSEVLPESAVQGSYQQPAGVLDMSVAMQQASPPLIDPPSEPTVTFPSASNTTTTFSNSSSSYISHGVDLSSLGHGEVAGGGFADPVPHKCVKCESSFATPYELAIHWQEEHRDNYKCKRCDRCFAKKHNLQRHNCVNTCNVCGQQFTRRYNLKLHMQVHGEGNKMYKCEYCGKSFTRRYTLLTHVRSHSGIKLFKCSICGKAFTRQHTLNLHLKRHVTKSTFFCRKCFAVFTDAVSLQLHREREHFRANKAQRAQQSAPQPPPQPAPSTSNVVFPNSNPGYMYSADNVSQPSAYPQGPYYQSGSHDQTGQLQRSYQENGAAPNANPEQEGFDDSRDPGLHDASDGSAQANNKPSWFEEEDTGLGSAAKRSGNVSQERESSDSANIVTVVDSDEEVVSEELKQEESADVPGEVAEGEECPVIQSVESLEEKPADGQEPEPEKEMRRSLFPLDNSRREKRPVRHLRRPGRDNWLHSNKLVKETSEIRIDIVHPSSLEEINPLLTPPRSSETSTPRHHQASSESGSPGAASFQDGSPSYIAQQHSSKAAAAASGSPDDKASPPTRPYLHEEPEPVSLAKAPRHSGGNHPRTNALTAAANSDCSSSSEILSQQQSLRRVPHRAAGRGKEAGGEADGKWRCAHCGITFEESLMYVVHMGCHGQRDPFQCSMCGLACTDRMAFTLHIIGGKHVRPKP